MRDLVARIILRDALPLSRCTLTWTAGLYLATRVPLMSELPEPVLLKGGEFKARHQISLADAIIAAYAFVHHAILVHKDPEFEALTMVNQMKLPYKRNEKTNEGRGCRLLN